MKTIRKHKKLIIISALVLIAIAVYLLISPFEGKFKGEMIVLAITFIFSFTMARIVFKEMSED